MWNVVRRIKCLHTSGLVVTVEEQADMELMMFPTGPGSGRYYCREVRFMTEAGQRCLDDHGLLKVLTGPSEIQTLVPVEEINPETTRLSKRSDHEHDGRCWNPEEYRSEIGVGQTVSGLVSIVIGDGKTLNISVSSAEQIVRKMQEVMSSIVERDGVDNGIESGDCDSEATGLIFSLARQALCIMVLDLEYGSDIRPVYGHSPMRHNALWGYCREALGKEFDTELSKLMAAKETEPPIKTCPMRVG